MSNSIAAVPVSYLDFEFPTSKFEVVQPAREKGGRRWYSYVSDLVLFLWRISATARISNLNFLICRDLNLNFDDPSHDAVNEPQHLSVSTLRRRENVLANPALPLHPAPKRLSRASDSVSSTSVNTICLCSAPGSKANGKREGQDTRRQTPAGGELPRLSGACEPELLRSHAPTSRCPQPSPPPPHCGRSQPIAVMRPYFWAFPGFVRPPIPLPSPLPPSLHHSCRRRWYLVLLIAGLWVPKATGVVTVPSPNPFESHLGKWVVGLLDAPMIDRSYKRWRDFKPTNMASTCPNSNSPLVEHSGDDALPSPDTTDSDSEGEYSSSDSDDSDARLAGFAHCTFCGAKQYSHTLLDYRIRDPRLMLRVTPVGNIICHIGGDRAVVNLYCGRDPTKFLIPFVEIINNILCFTWICSVCLQKAFIVVVPLNDENWGVDGYKGAQRQRFVPFSLDGPQCVD
ncbi:hypothetical protein FPV67DRAFT_1452396 [Lyophyllum atratum]|nr:hypothetical protein FPV67DRAFT_1452396 [Lyophyllum atratum]